MACRCLLALYGVLLIAASGCDHEDSDAGTTVDELRLTRTVLSPKGPAEITAKGTPLGWESGDQVFDDASFRDSLVADIRKWEGGVIPYYWPVSGAEDCGTDQDAWCDGERTQAEAVVIDPAGRVSAAGAVATGKETFANHTSVSLIDVTDIAPRPPGALAIQRRGFETAGDQPVLCQLDNNVSQPEEWLISFEESAWWTPGVWELVLNLSLGESQLNIAGNASELSEITFQAYADLADQSGWCPGCGDPPLLLGTVPGDITLTRAVSGAGFEPAFLSTPSSEDRVTVIALESACQVNGCANSGCEETFVCNGIFAPDAMDPKGGEYSTTDGVCQKGNGLAEVGSDDAGSSIWFGTHHLTDDIQSTIVHEFMHSFGFVHEQNRPDAAAFLQIAKEECVEPGRIDGDLNLMSESSGIVFDGENAGFGLSPNEPGDLDFISSMMYASGNACRNDEQGCNRQCLVAKSADSCPEGVCAENPSGPGYQIRPPQWSDNRPPEDFDKDTGRGKVNLVARKSGMSESDMDALRWYYTTGFARSSEVGVLNSHPDCLDSANCADSPLTADCFQDADPLGLACSPWVGDEVADRFGSVLGLGAFGDENNAILVGVPDEALDFPATPTASGILAIFEGRFWSEHRALRRIPTHSPSHTLSVADARRQDAGLVSPPSGGDLFGGAVATLDINDDGWGDVAVSAPGRDEVFIFTGGPSHGEQQELLGVVSGVPGDDFGASLASTRIDGRDVLLVGVPGAARVELYSETAILNGFPDGELTSLLHGPGSRFGAAITSIPNLNVGPDHVLVGAPESGGDAGAILIYRSAVLAGDSSPSSVLSGAPGDQLGRDLAVGDLTSDFLGLEVVATAPLSQRVYVFYTTPNMFFQVLNNQTTVDMTDAGEPFDATAQFGASVAIADEREDGSGFLAVGAPGENVDGVIDAGAVYFFRFQDNGSLVLESGSRHTSADSLPCLNTADLPFNVECDEPLDATPAPFAQLGAALAANEDIIVAGAPGASASGMQAAGRIYVWVRGRQDEPPPIGDPNYDSDQFFLMHWYSESFDAPTLEAYDQ